MHRRGDYMKLTDIIALAKQGYTPGDIRELLAIAEETSQEPAESATEPGSAPVMEPAAEIRTEEAEKAAPETDSKDEKISELENKIRDLQAENTRRPRPEETPKKSGDEILKDIARRLM